MLGRGVDSTVCYTAESSAAREAAASPGRNPYPHPPGWGQLPASLAGAARAPAGQRRHGRTRLEGCVAFPERERHRRSGLRIHEQVAAAEPVDRGDLLRGVEKGLDRVVV